MFSNETIRKLREIHMGVMAEQLSAQLGDPQFRNVTFEDRLAMLVDAEWSAQKSNRLTGLIKKAGYADTQASVENIEYIAERHLDREQILRLASCSYIQEARNVIILALPVLERHSWPVPWVWRPTGTSTPLGISGCRIFWWRSLWPGGMGPIGNI